MDPSHIALASLRFKMQMVLEERDLWDVTCRMMIHHCGAEEEDQAMYQRMSRNAFTTNSLAIEDW